MPDTSYGMTIEKRQSAAKRAVLDALREMPIVQIACKRAGIGRATYYRWRAEDADFSAECDAAVREGIDLINDMGESQIIQLIKEKKLPAIALWLRYNSPKYGGRAPARAPGPLLAALGSKDEKLFRKALALSSGAYAARNHATPR